MAVAVKTRGHIGEPYKVIEVRSWKKLRELFDGPTFRSWAFRGQASAGWPLLSSLSRYLRDFQVHPDAWADQEERSLRIFRRKAHLFLDHVPAETEAFEWLALMQHYGAPTRLLDFTWSPYVAIFFAIERATENAAVWALNPPELWRVKHRLPGRTSKVKGSHLGLRTPGHYEEYFLRGSVPFVTTGEPLVMNKRLIAQSGTFIAPSLIDRPVEAILSDYPNPDATIVKLALVTNRLREEAMLGLYNMNLTQASLFPGLDGLARSIAYELEFHWAFNPKTMEARKGF